MLGEKGPKPNQKVFHSSIVYFTFFSKEGATIQVKPLFIDPSKANSLKYVTSHNLNKFDGSITGIDESKIPS